MGDLADRMRRHIVGRFYGEVMPEGLRRLFSPTPAYQAALVYEHWCFLQGFPRWVGSIIAGTDKLDVIEYEVDNLYGELIHDPGAKGGHYAIVLSAGVEAGLSSNELTEARPGPKMALALKDWYDIARTRSWIETMAAVHGTEMLADQNLKKVPGYSLPHIMGDEPFLRPSTYSPSGKRFLGTTRADTQHAGRAAELVEKYAPTSEERDNIFKTFVRSMDNMELYFEAIRERYEEFRVRFHESA